MTALSRRSKRAYIIGMFKCIVGSCQRESALKPLILMATFVTNSELGAMFSTNVQTNTTVTYALTDRLHACITMNQAYSWSETIDASYRGKGELPARP